MVEMHQEEKRNSNAPAPDIFYGIGASPGVVIGKILHLGRKNRQRKQIHLSAGDVAQEKNDFTNAVDRAEQQLTEARNAFAEHLTDYISIIDTHILMLRDKMLYDCTLALIETEKINAEWALEKALNRARAAFKRIGDKYLSERVHDVEQVAARVFELLAGGEQEDPFAAIDEKVIVVARDFSPADTIKMRSQFVLGFLTEMGGATSHTAIVARSLGIPAVVGVEKIARQVANGEMVILDGSGGRVFVNPTRDQLAQYQECQRQYERYSGNIAQFTHLAAETIDGQKVRVNANIELLEETPAALEYGAAGIGLFRSEYYYIGKKEVPDEERLFTLYKDLLLRLAPFPVTIRTLDVGGDKLDGNLSLNGEANPAMGLRAIRLSLRVPEIFITQLRALFRASVYGNLRVMFPMVSSVCQITKVKELIAEAKAGLDRDDLPYDGTTAIGVMIEVPSAVSVADVLAREVDFFSIGTNDLIQYALAIDRGNEHVAHMYEPLHPAVLRMIRQVVEVGHAAGIEVGMCGEMAGDVTYLPLLLGLGLDELSMHPFAIPYVKRMIRTSTAAEAEQLVQEVMACSTALEVHQCLVDYLPRRYPDEFGDSGVRMLKRSCCSILLEERQN